MSTDKTFHWTKQHAGFYTLDGTDYGVASSHPTADPDEHDNPHDLARVEWVVIKGTEPGDHNAGENLDWYDTMRQAKAEAERLARRDA